MTRVNIQDKLNTIYEIYELDQKSRSQIYLKISFSVIGTVVGHVHNIYKKESIWDQVYFSSRSSLLNIWSTSFRYEKQIYQAKACNNPGHIV